MPSINTSRQKLNELVGTRAGMLKAAQDALDKGNQLEYKAQLDKAKALNGQIDELQGLVKEFDRYDIAHAPLYGNDPYDMKDMGERLQNHERVSFNPMDVLKQIKRPQDSLTFGGTLVQPTGGGSEVHDGFNAQASTLINLVRAEDFNGMTSWEEPYLKSIQEAQAGSVTEVGGTVRTASDPVFRKAKIMATEMSVTSFVDKNISRLSPANYAAKVQQYAMTALLRKGNDRIINGDGKSSPEMFGIQNAKNTDGEAIFQTMSDVTAINADTLRNLVFGYGGDEEVAANARLVLNKKALYQFGQVKLKTGDNRKLYEITQSGNTGTIKEGGLTVNYTLASKCGDTKLLYGDPSMYLLGLFGPYSIRIDESVKSVERMIAILGDVLIGGNLVADKCWAVETLSTASAGGSDVGG